MSTLVRFSDGENKQLSGALATPVGPGKVGGVVVVQEFWGLTEYIESVCDRLAESGFLALAPDLFHGVLPATKAEAAGRMAALDVAAALSELDASANRLRSDDRCNGRIAVLGFCMGGGLTLAAARSLGGLAAAVPFYGIPALPAEAFAGVQVPIQAHFAKNDEWAKSSIAEQIRARVAEGGGAMQLFVYDVGHAFMRETDASVYSPEQARVAWGRAIDFLKQHLAS
jgi:carboxymethylenebutenolidase